MRCVTQRSWLRTADAGPQREPTSAASRRGDVPVLAGGLAGLSAELAFARRGRRVLVLERDPLVIEVDAVAFGAAIELTASGART